MAKINTTYMTTTVRSKDYRSSMYVPKYARYSRSLCFISCDNLAPQRLKRNEIRLMLGSGIAFQIKADTCSLSNARAQYTRDQR